MKKNPHFLWLHEEKYGTVLHVLEIILQNTDSAKALQSQALQSQGISKHRFCKTHFPLQHCSLFFPPAPFPFYVKLGASLSSVILGTAVEVTGAQAFQQLSECFFQTRRRPERKAVCSAEMPQRLSLMHADRLHVRRG